MKKGNLISILSLLIIVAIMLVPITGALGKTTPKDEFDKAIEKTQDTIEKELEIIQENNFMQNILSDGINKNSLNAEVKSVFDKEVVASGKLSQEAIVNSKNGDFNEKFNLSVEEINLSGEITKKDDFSYLTFPKLFKGTYSINNKSTKQDIINSQWAEYMQLLDEDEVFEESELGYLATMVETILDSTNTSEINNKIELIKSDMLKFNDGLEAIIKNYETLGVYTKTENQIVDSKRGKIITDKITFSLSKENSNKLLEEIKVFMKKDKNLKNAIDRLYGDMFRAMDIQSFGEYVVEELLYSSEDYVFTGNFERSIYINKSGHIYRNEIILPLRDEYYEYDEELIIQWDTKGNLNLLDEVEMSYIIKDEYCDSGFRISNEGFAIPNNGVIKSNLEFALLETYSYEDETEVDNTNIFTLKQEYDLNKTENNFKASLVILPDEEVKQDISFSGDYVYDEENGNLRLNVKKGVFRIEDEIELRITLDYKIEKVSDETVITTPKNAVKVTDLSTEVFMGLIEEIGTNVYDLVEKIDDLMY